MRVKTKRININMPEWQHTELERIQKEKGHMSLSDTYRDAFDKYIEQNHE